MSTQDFIMLIMNCKKYQKKAKFQKLTWLKTIPTYLKYYHVIGDESLDVDFKFDNENNIFQQCCSITTFMRIRMDSIQR